MQAVRITGIDRLDRSGRSVSTIGDLDGDGMDEVLVGAPFADPDGAENAGEAYVVLGSALSASAGHLPLAELSSDEVIVIKGGSSGVSAGFKVSEVGDVDGDGLDDFIISAAFAAPGGQATVGACYLIFGSTIAAGARELDLATLTSDQGVILRGGAGDSSGQSVSSAGDVDGDGLDDVVIGAPSANRYVPEFNGSTQSGKAYLVYGSALTSEKAMDGVISLTAMTPLEGVEIIGKKEYEFIGTSVSAAGDVDGDGKADIVIGAPVSGEPSFEGAGGAYVVFGAALTASGGTLDLEVATPEHAVFLKGIDSFDGAGTTVSSAGDVDGDGLDDVIIGTRDRYPVPTDFHSGSGEAYLVYGSAIAASDGVFEITSLTADQGVIISGGYPYILTMTVSSAGDLDKDGLDDLIVGIPDAGTRQGEPGDTYVGLDAGKVVVVFGTALGDTVSTIDLSLISPSQGVLINGVRPGDRIGAVIASAGDVDGDGINDLIIGSSGASPGGVDRAGESYVVSGAWILSERAEDGEIDLQTPASGVPQVLGTPMQGETLTADLSQIFDPEGINLESVEYQWVYAHVWAPNGVPISGATEATLTLGEDDVQLPIGVRVSFLDGFGESEILLSAGTSRVSNVNDFPQGQVQVSLVARTGQGTSVNLMNGNRLVVFSNDDAPPNINPYSSPPDPSGDVYGQLYDGLGTPVGPPFLINSTTFHTQYHPSTLQFADGSFVVAWAQSQTGSQFGVGYQRYDFEGNKIGDEVVLPTQNDPLDTYSLSALGGDGFVINVGRTGETLVVSGTTGENLYPVVQQGQTLMADTMDLADADGLGPLTYQWLRDGLPISGATISTFTLTQSDVGAEVSVNVSYIDGHRTKESVTSEPTAPVINVNGLPTGGVTVIGAPQQGATLLVDSAILADEDGLGALSYQWLRNGSPIVNATSQTYMLASSDVGARVSVRVSYTDGWGTAESVVSSNAVNIFAVLDGFSGPDVLVGTSGPDFLFGLNGDDWLFGYADEDYLDGGPDSDRLVGGLGSDSLIGGDGFDLLFGEDRGVFFTAISAQVYRLYAAVLGREPDWSGHQTWTARLTLDQMTLTDAARGFVASPEFQSDYGNTTNVEFITLLYNNVLHRDPDQIGLGHWINSLDNGMTRVAVVLHFAESPEHRVSTTDAQLAYDAARIPNSWTDEVYRVYRAIFDRDPDTNGLIGWVEKLANASFDMPQVIAHFMASAEFQLTYGDTTDTDFVTLLYRNVLAREPEATGLTGWVDALEGGVSREKVVGFFMISAEFVSRTKAGLEDYIAGFGPDDVLVPGPGDAVVAGGLFADTFVFDSDGLFSTVTVTDLEPWDMLDFGDFFLTEQEVLDGMRQQGNDVIFNAEAETIIFGNTDLGMISSEMILV